MASLIPGSLETQTRSPLDGKYWIQTFADINNGLTFQGLMRFDRSTEKLWIKLNAQWIEILTTSNVSASTTIAVGTVTGSAAGTLPVITNSGTQSNAVFDFIIPKGDKGTTPIIDIGTVTNGETLSVVNVGTTDRAILNFIIPQGVDGQSVWVAYSKYSTGQNATYILNTAHRFISILEGSVQPPLADFNTWVKFVGDPGGPAGESAYQTWQGLGNSGTQQDFLTSLKGTNGQSAYELWKALGNAGTESQFLDSLVSGNYALPPATDTRLGGVKEGARVTIDNTGVISANVQSDTNFTAIEKGKLAGLTQADVNKAYVDESCNSLQNKIYNNDANAVHKTGNETIYGKKTFDEYVTAPFFIGNGSQLTNLPNNIYKAGTGANSIVPVIGGNVATGEFASVLGGSVNEANGRYSCVITGSPNYANGAVSFIGGGALNDARGPFSVIVGGSSHRCFNNFGFIGGGQGNYNAAYTGTIAGGELNEASGDYASILGGQLNIVAGNYSFIPGGKSNKANGLHSSASGLNNQSFGNHCHIHGGHDNTIDSTSSGVYFINCDNKSVVGETNKVYINNQLFVVGATQAYVDAANALKQDKPISSNYNTFYGFETNSTNSGNNTTAVGHGAGSNNTGSIISIGVYAGGLNTGNAVVTIGDYAGFSNSGSFNTFLGFTSGRQNTSGGNNTNIGYNSGASNLTGFGNTYVGSESGQNATGSNNTALGGFTLDVATTGDANTAIGYNSLRTTTTGSGNTSLGNEAGRDITTGNDNVSIGSFAGPLLGTLINTVSIGTNTRATIDNTLILGNNQKVGIGTTTPASKLTVVGDIESSTSIILKSPNGTRYKITVDNAGVLTTTSI